jgi:hypothetical protein
LYCFAFNIVIAAGEKASEWEEREIALAVVISITLLQTFLPSRGVREINAVKVTLLLFIIVTGWIALSGRVLIVKDPYASLHNSFAGSATSSNLYATALFKMLNSYSSYSGQDNNVGDLFLRHI